MRWEMPTKEQWEEIQRLALRAAQKQETTRTLADLLAAIGVIHNTPAAKREWMG